MGAERAEPAMSAAEADDEARTHEAPRVSRRPLAIALAISTIFLVVEAVGGWLTGSLALLADAGHMVTDVAALGLSIGAIWLARRPATPRRSFGYLRAEVLAALVNAAALIVISVLIFWEAARRIGQPPEVHSGEMLVIAVAGLIANATSARVLMRGGGHDENLNTRGAFLHVVGDMLGSAGAILAAAIMLTTGWYLADPILSAGIGLLIVWSAWRLLTESVDVLLEATPKSVDVARVREAMLAVPGVCGVHDLHVWTVTSGLISLSSHVEVTGTRDWCDALLDLTRCLREEFGIAHVTLQPEEPHTAPHPFRGCTLDTPRGRSACLVPQSRPANGAHPHAHHHH